MSIHLYINSQGLCQVQVILLRTISTSSRRYPTAILDRNRTSCSSLLVRRIKKRTSRAIVKILALSSRGYPWTPGGHVLTCWYRTSLCHPVMPHVPTGSLSNGFCPETHAQRCALINETSEQQGISYVLLSPTSHHASDAGEPEPGAYFGGDSFTGSEVQYLAGTQSIGSTRTNARYSGALLAAPGRPAFILASL